MKYTTMLSGIGIVIVGLFVISYLAMPAVAEETTQNFKSNNYSLLSAEVNVALLQENGEDNTQRCLFKINNSTGEVWVLQLSVGGENDPTVKSAVWYPVSSKIKAKFKP